MSRYFPRHTHELQAIEPAALRRLSLSLVETALITGITLRLLRAVALTHGPAGNWMYLGGVLVLGAVILFGMASLHLANFTPRHWVWRAPAFAVLVALGEMMSSAVLILFGREPMGTGRADWNDWWSLSASVLGWRIVTVCIFAVALAGVVHLVRGLLIRSERNAAAAKSLSDELYSDAPESEIDKDGRV